MLDSFRTRQRGAPGVSSLAGQGLVLLTACVLAALGLTASTGTRPAIGSRPLCGGSREFCSRFGAAQRASAKRDRPSEAAAEREDGGGAGSWGPASEEPGSGAEPRSSQEQDWPFYGGDQAGSKFSPLTEINRETAAHLTLAWEWSPREKALPDFGTRPGAFEVTPLMIDNVLYLSTPYNRVVALNAETGAELWSFDPKAYEDGQPPNGTGFVHRGVAAWRDSTSGKLRIFMNSRYHLICLDAGTGQLVPSFGDRGIVDLSLGLIWEINKKHYTNTSPPIVYRDLVILGNGVGDRLVYKNDPPGDVRAFDARTGRQIWSFHTIPQQGEPGNETWANDSWKYTGHTNVWAPMTLDDRRGLVYLPVSTPSNDFFGGRRPGANLFADSLVCLDAATGRRRWHFQIVHHGLWDYDNPSPPNLVTIHPRGQTVEAVVQLTKQGFAFAFDRLTGDPIWPIEERPVPTSDVEGEQAWPTQPVPIKPPPFTEQGVTPDDVFDLAPALKAAAQEQMSALRLGPVYTPPSDRGTLQRPGIIGGANWGGGAFDPESGVLFVKTSNQAHVARIGRPNQSPADPRTAKRAPERAGQDAEARPRQQAGEQARERAGARAGEVDAEYTRVGDTTAEFMNGLPLLKPPYGHVVAIDLNQGEIKWRVPFGDTPSIRRHPALEGVALPAQLGVAGAPGLIATRGGLLFVGGGDAALHALDEATGAEIWRAPLPRRTTGTPMTYRSRAGRQFVVVATGAGEDAALMAFALSAPSR